MISQNGSFTTQQLRLTSDEASDDFTKWLLPYPIAGASDDGFLLLPTTKSDC